MPAEVVDSYLRPSYRSARIRRDATRFIAGIHHRHTMAAAESLSGFGKPVLLVRAADDRIFAPALFDRLAAILPDARHATVADSGTFIPEDRPAELAELITEFATGR
jgi:pimeloyl-ACP methyl ester carboxylesterase